MRQAKRKVTPEIQPTHRSGRPVVFRISWGVRKYIIKRDGFICKYCGEKLNLKTHTIDHILPVAHGGTEHPDNLVMCCAGCNRRAKDNKFDSFESKQEYLRSKAIEARKSIAANRKNNDTPVLKITSISEDSIIPNSDNM